MFYTPPTTLENMKKLALLIALGIATLNPAFAAPLRADLGGPAGYGQLTQNPNDDGSSSQMNLPFQVNFFGKQFNTFFVNNNGNISFGNNLSAYTPRPFPASTLPVIAPYWADVDTRAQPNGGAVYAAAPNADTVVVTWNNVGYYNQRNDKLNDFQLTLRNRADTGAGNFDIEFRYNKLEWTTGSHSTSGGVDGLGGIPAQAGYDAGNGTNFFVLPGSFSANVLNLVNTSNVSLDQPGVWTMAIRSGTTSNGTSAEAPLLPQIVTEAGFQFDFNINLNERIFIDPEVAVGYDYEVQTGPNITSVLLPLLAGDTDGYEIFGRDGSLLGTVLGGDIFDFATGGVDFFRVGDIDAGLDPANTQAFVTGLTFAGEGRVRMTQRPIVVNTDTDVPEPGSLLLLSLGGVAFAVSRRKQRAARKIAA